MAALLPSCLGPAGMCQAPAASLSSEPRSSASCALPAWRHQHLQPSQGACKPHQEARYPDADKECRSLQQRCSAFDAPRRAGRFMLKCKKLGAFTWGGSGGRPQGSLRHLSLLPACAAGEARSALPAQETVCVAGENRCALPTSTEQRDWCWSLCPGCGRSLHNSTACFVANQPIGLEYLCGLAVTDSLVHLRCHLRHNLLGL